MQQMIKTCDVLVVGGGISGLRTALLLQQQNIKVIVIEANKRVGGRLKGEKYDGVQFDVGGQWIGPQQRRVNEIIKELNLKTTEQYKDGLHITQINGRTEKNRTTQIPGILSFYHLPFFLLFEWKINYMAKQVPLEAPWTAKNAEEWDNQTLENWLQKNTNFKIIHSLIEIIVWALLCTDPSRISFLWFLWFVHSAGSLKALIETQGGAQQDKVIGGAVQIAQSMYRLLNHHHHHHHHQNNNNNNRITDDGDHNNNDDDDDHNEDKVVYLSSPALSIDYNDRFCLTKTPNFQIKSKRVIITCPPMIASRIRYSPPLPAIRDQFSQSMPMSQVIKSLIFYKSPFWRNNKLCGESTSDRSIRLTFDASLFTHNLNNENENNDGNDNDENNNNIIDGDHDHAPIYGVAAFFLADEAVHFADKTAEERRLAVENHLSVIFRTNEAYDSIGYIEGNWVNEEWNRGGYMAVPGPSVLTRYGEALRTPIGRLHFAGTETATEWSGYMEGALQSAERVVSEVAPLICDEILKKDDLMLSRRPVFNYHRKNRWLINDDRESFFSQIFNIPSFLLFSSAIFGTYFACRYSRNNL